jgi:hypothetical protein
MRCHSARYVMVLAVAGMIGFLRPAMGQTPKPETPQRDLNSPQSSPGVRSTPPDNRNRYFRPAIPEDLINTPLQSDQSSPHNPSPCKVVKK